MREIASNLGKTPFYFAGYITPKTNFTAKKRPSSPPGTKTRLGQATTQNQPPKSTHPFRNSRKLFFQLTLNLYISYKLYELFADRGSYQLMDRHNLGQTMQE
jgi:hypothetical protein